MKESKTNSQKIAKDGLLDRRTELDFYNQSWALAKRYFPKWTSSYPEGFVPDFNASSISDPGLVTLRLFADLARYLTQQINFAPTNQNLSFYDFLGLKQQLPELALAPIVYDLAPNDSSVIVEKGRQVTADYDPQILFEMLRTVKVLPLTVSEILFIDSYSDTRVSYGSQLGNPGISNRFPHQLYLGDVELFNFMSSSTEVEIRFYGSNLSKEWFSQWVIYDNKSSFKVDVHGDYDQLTALLSPNGRVSEIVSPLPDALSEKGADLSWIRIEPLESARVVENGGMCLPEITLIEAVLLDREGVIPDCTAFNDSPLDIKKGVNPFGKTPQTKDAFYIGSFVFGMKGVSVSLKVEISPLDTTNISAQLTWEYWDGLEWLPMLVNDGTNSFTQSGNILFQLSEQVKSCTINGLKNYWVRCCITSGAYGFSGQTVITESAAQIFSRVPSTVLCDCVLCDPNVVRSNLVKWFDGNHINFGFKYQSPQYWPPFIKSLLISYEYVKSPSESLAYNSGLFTTLEEDRRPYIPSNSFPALCIGFQVSESLIPFGEVFSVLFILKENCRMCNIDPEFHYWTGKQWKAMPLEWIDYQLVGAFIVGLRIPEDIDQSYLYGSKKLLWVSMKSSFIRNPADLFMAIYVNAGIAVGYSTIENKVLGSGTGQADFSIKCPSVPVLNLKLELFEESESSNDFTIDSGSSTTVPNLGIEGSSEENIPDNEDSINVVEGEENSGIWVRWKEVNTFAFSGPRDRVYILDPIHGIIYFGNGVQGMSVPTGDNNIRAKFYQTPLNKSQSMVPVGSLNQLQTSDSGIQSVRNPMMANGAVNMQTRPDFLKKAPSILKSRQRAMSSSDFIALAKLASPRVARASLISNLEQTTVDIQILTDVVTDSYVPSRSLINQVEAYLRTHTVASASSLIRVFGPQYLPVDIVVQGVPVQKSLSESERADFNLKIRESIRHYLDPIQGGPTQKGWNPGEEITMYPLSKRLKELSLLKHVEVFGLKGQSRIPMRRDVLPVPGDLDILFLTTGKSQSSIRASSLGKVDQ